MLTVAIITAITGAILGLRFKVFVLAPAMTFASMVIILIATTQNESLAAVLLALGITVVMLQLGFFCGILLRGCRVFGWPHSRALPQAGRAISDSSR